MNLQRVPQQLLDSHAADFIVNRIGRQNLTEVLVKAIGRVRLNEDDQGLINFIIVLMINANLPDPIIQLFGIFDVGSLLEEFGNIAKLEI